jgi:hypothetical protein
LLVLACRLQIEHGNPAGQQMRPLADGGQSIFWIGAR